MKKERILISTEATKEQFDVARAAVQLIGRLKASDTPPTPEEYDVVFAALADVINDGAFVVQKPQCAQDIEQNGVVKVGGAVYDFTKSAESMKFTPKRMAELCGESKSRLLDIQGCIDMDKYACRHFDLIEGVNEINTMLAEAENFFGLAEIVTLPCLSRLEQLLLKKYSQLPNVGTDMFNRWKENGGIEEKMWCRMKEYLNTPFA